MAQNDGQSFIKATSYLSTTQEDLPVLNEPFPAIPDLKGDPFELPYFEPAEGLLKIIEGRRSVREYLETPMSINDLTKMIWGIHGVTGMKNTHTLRTVASAGNKHPVNTYVVANKVTGLAKGVYLYDRINTCLLPIRKDDYEAELVAASLEQAMVVDSAVTFIWTAITARTTEKYQARGYRYIFIDVGHIGGQLQLVCQDMGYGLCNIAAFFDDSISRFLGLKSEFEVPVYMATVGWPKSQNP